MGGGGVYLLSDLTDLLWSRIMYSQFTRMSMSLIIWLFYVMIFVYVYYIV